MSLFPTLQEIRSSIATPEKWLVDWVRGGSETAAGRTVNEISAMNNSAVFNAVTIISGILMQLPLHLYRRTTDNGKEKATSHPLYQVVHGRVRPPRAGMPGMTAARWIQAAAGHVCTWGNSYNFRVFNGAGQIAEIHPIRPDRMRLEERDGRIVYEYTPRQGGPVEIPHENMLHIPGFGFDGIQGYSVVTLAREGIGLSLATEEFGARWFGSGTHPGIVVSTPKALKKDTRDALKKQLSDKYAGLGKSHRLLLLEEDMKPIPISVSPEDSQFLETRKFQVIEIARWFNLPAYLLKEMDGTIKSNIEQQSIELLTIHMGPWITLFETELTYGLLRQDEIDAGYFIEFDLNGLLRGDIKARYDAYAVGKQWGFLNTNMVLRKENEQTIGPDGDKFWMPVNMIEVGSELPPAAAVAERMIEDPAHEHRTNEDKRRAVMARNRLSKQYRRLLEDAAGRMVRREVNDVRQAVRKYLSQRSASEFERWLRAYYDDLPERVKENMAPVITAYAESIRDAARDEIGSESDVKSFEKFVADYIGTTAARWAGSSQGQINQLLNESEDPAAAIEQRLDEWDKTRAGKVAARETVDGRSAFANVVFFAAGYRVIWINQGSEECPYCKQMDGRVIERGGYYLKEGESLDAGEGKLVISGPKTHPQLHQGCDCITAASR
ncbi:phage portal protein [bacterium]|nr:phage portal protein [bacterium]